MKPLLSVDECTRKVADLLAVQQHTQTASEETIHLLKSCFWHLSCMAGAESHLMTKEEVKTTDLWDFCYLEQERLPGKETRMICGDYALFCATWPRITQAKQEYGMENYGKTWRCWTAGLIMRPDGLLRKKTPLEV